MDALKKVQEKEIYDNLTEVVKLVKETAGTKFDGTCEVHFNLNIDPKKADQVIRGTLSLPHGTGKTIRIAAIVPDNKVKEAKAAGAVAAGLEDLIDEFSKGKIDYDVIVAMPEVMKQIGKVAKTLGQKGLMPNPKAGTVTDEIETTIKELLKGRIEYRNDKQGLMHLIFGKVSFKEEELENNLKSILKTLTGAKPTGVKGTFIQSMSVNATMGPGIPVDINAVLKTL